jgi:hypothetical protein
MTRNPYAHPVEFETEPAPSRVSGLAIASLVFGILCCIPFFGIIAMILGGSAMIVISRSEGRLGGRGLAIAGMVLGLLGTLFTAFAGFATLQGVAQIQSLSGSYSYVEQKDYARFRTLMTPSASQKVTDQQIDEFQQKVEGVWGKSLGPTKGLGDIISSYMDAVQQAGSSSPTLRGQILPVPMKFDKGTALAFFEINPRQTNTRNNPGIENIVVLDPSGGPIWLIPPAGSAPSTPPAPAPAPTTPPSGEQPDQPPPQPGG